MGAPVGNCNAAKNKASCKAKSGKKRFPANVKGIYGEKVRVFEILGHTARTDKGWYHTSKLFNKKGKSIWKKRGY